MKKEVSEKKLKTSKVLATISWILALMPLLIMLIIIVAMLTAESGSASGLFLVIGYIFICIPISIASLICGLISFIMKRNLMVVAAILIDLIPLYIYIILRF